MLDFLSIFGQYSTTISTVGNKVFRRRVDVVTGFESTDVLSVGKLIKPGILIGFISYVD